MSSHSLCLLQKQQILADVFSLLKAGQVPHCSVAERYLDWYEIIRCIW